MPVWIERGRAARVLAALTLAAALRVAAQPAPTGAPPPVRAELVAGRVYVLTGGGGANSSLFVGPEGALLVDTKSAAATHYAELAEKR